MIKFQTQWSRREFLTSVAGASAALVLNPLDSLAIDEIDPRVAEIVAATMGIDSHNHIEVPSVKSEVPGPKIDLAGDLKKSGLSAICMTFAVDRPELKNPGDAYERFINNMDSMDKQLADNGMKRSLNLAELKTAHKKHQPTVIQLVEGGHFLEGKIERLQKAYSRGLRHLGLLHDNDASVPLGDVYTNTPRRGGLTAFGADVIKECNRLGILIDLAHANGETVSAALKLAAHPVIISHTGLDTQLGQNQNMARVMRPRLISKEQAKIVADAGGVIGVWTHLAETPMEYAQNVRALVDVVGIDHVCIGTDTKLTASYRPAGAQNGPDGGQKGERVGERTNLAWQDQKFGFYYTVVDAMLKTGFTKDEIGKFGGGNFCRLFDAATSGHH
ncbi:dipeptidase [Dyadobacter subterraneus]|uniref:Membrane dipeptidase n=1 Tax=Dyadobacter subterraneus TaxID=2773304 RepID=A0ABR9W7F1_9BACT|nr:membrane dipeptidase [Dyadobacter subterraneus]MBE9461396.1 membrane dipeptidase [Dyadobacter subterraneus]